MSRLISFPYVLMVFQFVSGDTQWLSPPGSATLGFVRPSYSLGSIVNLTWNTTLTNYTIRLEQQAPNSAVALLGNPVYVKLPSEPESTGTSWNVSLEDQPFDLGFSNVFYLVFEDPDQDQTTHLFNISHSSEPSSTPSLSATIALTSMLSTSPPPVAMLLSSGSTKTGHIIGLSIGISLLLLVGALMFLIYHGLRERTQRVKASEVTQQSNFSNPRDAELRKPQYSSHDVGELHAQRAMPPEMSMDWALRELPAIPRLP